MSTVDYNANPSGLMPRDIKPLPGWITLHVKPEWRSEAEGDTGEMHIRVSSIAIVYVAYKQDSTLESLVVEGTGLRFSNDEHLCVEEPIAQVWEMIRNAG